MKATCDAKGPDDTSVFDARFEECGVARNILERCPLIGMEIIAELEVVAWRFPRLRSMPAKMPVSMRSGERASQGGPLYGAGATSLTASGRHGRLVWLPGMRVCMQETLRRFGFLMAGLLSLLGQRKDCFARGENGVRCGCFVLA